MEIQDRLFSETSGERYYSVLMNEEEYSLYSFLSKFNFGKLKNLKKNLKENLEKAAREIAYIGEPSAGSKVVTAAAKQQPVIKKLPKKT